MIVNVSRLDELQACEQKYTFRYIHNITGETTKDVEAPDLGTAVHAGIAAWIASGFVDDACDLGYSVKLDEIAPEHPQRGYGLKLLKAYREAHRQSYLECDILGIEQEFEIREGEHTYLGRWDLVVRKTVGGVPSIWHHQHKTAGNTTSMANYISKYELAFHEGLYTAALKRRFPNEIVAGCILDILRKVKDPKPVVDLLWHYIPVSDKRIKRFFSDAATLISRMQELENGRTPIQNPGSCYNYNKLCPFHDALCVPQHLIPFPEMYPTRELDYVDELRAKRALNEEKV